MEVGLAGFSSTISELHIDERIQNILKKESWRISDQDDNETIEISIFKNMVIAKVKALSMQIRYSSMVIPIINKTKFPCLTVLKLYSDRINNVQALVCMICPQLRCLQIGSPEISNIRSLRKMSVRWLQSLVLYETGIIQLFLKEWNAELTSLHFSDQRQDPKQVGCAMDLVALKTRRMCDISNIHMDNDKFHGCNLQMSIISKILNHKWTSLRRY